jgi:mono/diheme cytochrome c family protein
MKKLVLISIIALLVQSCGTALDLRHRTRSKDKAEANLTGRNKPLDELSAKVWTAIQAERQKSYDSYLQGNQAALDSFTKAPVGFNGTPAVILRLLPDVIPDLWSDPSVASFTGLFKSSPTDPFYYGMSLTKAPSASPTPSTVQFTCAACHTGRVMGPDGQVRILVGAPSTTFDINGYRTLLTASVSHPDYLYERFRDALLLKPDGALYGPDRIADERMDKAIFMSGPAGGPTVGQQMITQFKSTLLQRSAFVQQTLGAYSYHGDMTLLKNSPGHVEAFGFATLAFLPMQEFQADPTGTVVKYFGTNPSVADIMSVWRQADRVSAQWDGNIRNNLIRNLGAELGVAGDPRLVNFQNAVITTPFVADLPAPVYPFNVDLKKAIAGRVIYEAACASCHENEVFMSINDVGTEPGRATGLTSDARTLLVQNLKASCSDLANPDCVAPDEDIIVPRQDNPGYLSLPLTGIWARAPYLHNGSVPTMAQLLVPSTRPTVFRTGSLKYDQVNLGFVWNEDGKIYDTSILGYSNQGHADIKVFNGGIDFAKRPEMLKALIEYLKTL